MIVEFIGSTGAGKTTLLTEVHQRLPPEMRAVSQPELAQDALGWNRVTNPTVKNLIQDMAGLPYFLASAYRNRAFLGLCLRSLAPKRGHRLSSANYLRSIVRRIGMYELSMRHQLRHQFAQIILVDEGTVLSAHLLFVYGESACDPDDIERFARLVPLPDLIVYVRTPVDTLVRRALSRSDVRREMRAQSPAVVTEYISRAVTVFDRLVEVERIRERLLVMTNEDASEFGPSIIAERLVSCMLNCTSDGFPEFKRELPGYATHLP